MADAPEPLLEVRDQVVLKDAGRGVVSRVAARLDDHRRRQLHERMDDWLAPDPELARQVEARDPLDAGGATARAHTSVAWCRISKNVVVAMEREEAFERGRRLGFEPFMPFWDPGVVDFLLRTPPRLLHEATARRGFSAARSRGAFQRRGSSSRRRFSSLISRPRRS